MSLYKTVKTGYRRLFSKSVRRKIYIAMPSLLKVFRAKIISLVEKSAHHDEIYDDEYYTDCVDHYMAVSCDTIAESVVSVFSPKSAIDVGCGTGLFCLKDRSLYGCVRQHWRLRHAGYRSTKGR